MSTHNIGFYEDLTKIIFELSSNIIKYAPYFFCWSLVIFFLWAETKQIKVCTLLDLRDGGLDVVVRRVRGGAVGGLVGGVPVVGGGVRVGGLWPFVPTSTIKTSTGTVYNVDVAMVLRCVITKAYYLINRKHFYMLNFLVLHLISTQ